MLVLNIQSGRSDDQLLGHQLVQQFLIRGFALSEPEVGHEGLDFVASLPEVVDADLQPLDGKALILAVTSGKFVEFLRRPWCCLPEGHVAAVNVNRPEAGSLFYRRAVEVPAELCQTIQPLLVLGFIAVF